MGLDVMPFFSLPDPPSIKEFSLNVESFWDTHGLSEFLQLLTQPPPQPCV
jgi:hypothetical protein